MSTAVEAARKRLRKAVARARKRIRERAPQMPATPYLGPRGGQWADPEHTTHWEPPTAVAPSRPAASAHGLDLSVVSLNLDSVDVEEAAQHLHLLGFDADDLAPKGELRADVSVQRSADGEVSVQVYGARAKIGAERPVRLSATVNPDRSVYLDSMTTHPPGTGYGARLVSRMIARLQQAGFTHIELLAVRTDADEFSDPMNGYYTWPRFGWDAALDRRITTAPLDKLPASLAGAKRLSHLMETAEGRNWWREHGSSIPAIFDLSAGSVSSRVHAAYLEEKSLMRKAVGPELDTTAEDDAALDRAWARIRREREASEMAKARRNERNKLPGDVQKTFVRAGKTLTYWGPPHEPRTKRRQRLAEHQRHLDPDGQAVEPARRVSRSRRAEGLLDLSVAASVKWSGAKRSLLAERFLGDRSRGREILARAVGWTGFSQDDLRGARITVDAFASIEHPGRSHIRVQIILAESVPGELHGASRRYIIDGAERYAKHDSCELPGPPGTGRGALFFARAVEALAADGFQRIWTSTSGWGPKHRRGVRAEEKPTTGYYAWPRFGYDRELDKEKRKEIPRELLGRGKMLSDLMRTPEGRRWWRDHGSGMALSFDLAPDSLGRRVLAAYIAEKGLGLAKATGDAHRREPGVEHPPHLTPEDEAILDRIWDNIGRGAGDVDRLAKAEHHTTFQGLPIHVEHDRGDTRSGTAPDGTKWATKMSNAYGEITGTTGTDGDPIDVFIGPNPHATHAYCVAAKMPGTSDYDEMKCMLGFDTQDEAVTAFRRNYERPGFFLDVTKWPMPAFVELVRSHPDLQRSRLDAAVLAKVQARAMAKAKDLLPGGRADDARLEDFDEEELEQGTRHEMEHTSNRRIAREIAADHLTENPRYYRDLKRMERRAQKRLAKARKRIQARVAELAKARRNERNKLPGDVLKTFTRRGRVHSYYGPPDRASRVHRVSELQHESAPRASLGDEPLQDRPQTAKEFKAEFIRQEQARAERAGRKAEVARATLAYLQEQGYQPNRSVVVRMRRTDEGTLEFELGSSQHGWSGDEPVSIDTLRTRAEHYESQRSEALEQAQDAHANDAWKQAKKHKAIPASYDPRTTGRAAIDLANALTDDQLDQALTNIQSRPGRAAVGGRDDSFHRTVRGWKLSDEHRAFTLAEVAVLDALTLFTVGNVATCRDPSSFETSEATDELMGTSGWRVRPSAEAYQAAHIVLGRLASKNGFTEHDIYRGIDAPEQMVDGLAVGDELDLRSVSSWSKDPEVAQRFAGVKGKRTWVEPTGKPVVLQMRTRRGVDIADFSHYEEEREVIVGGRVRIVKVEPLDGGKLVTVEPIDDNLKKSTNTRVAALQAALDKALNERVSGRKKARRRRGPPPPPPPPDALAKAVPFPLPTHPEAIAALAVAMEKAYQHRAKPPKNREGWEPPGGTHPRTWRKGTPGKRGNAAPTSTHTEFKRAAARELVAALDRVSHPEAREQLERALVGLGLEKLHERGEAITFDGRRHRSEDPLFPGDAASVEHPGWAITDEGGPLLIRKADVRAARPVTTRTAETNASDAREAAWDVTQAAMAKLRERNPTGVTFVKIPELADEVIAAGVVPDAASFHDLLKTWDAEGRVWLTVCDNPVFESRAPEGIRSRNGLLFYVRLMPGGGTSSRPSAVAPVHEDAAALDARILSTMHAIEPRAASGELVSTPKLRTQMSPRVDKETFDAAVLRLADAGKLSLYRTDRAKLLEEQVKLPTYVTDGQGNYYNAVSVKRAAPARPAAPTLAERFAQDFERAFDDLRRDRMFNRVELHALRDALPQYSRTVFDRELARLRKAERFQLRTVDGRHHRLTDRERAAAIEERGEQYYYVSRWTSD